MADSSARKTGPALEALYRFLPWLVPTVEKFPRSQKFLLGDRIQATALDVLERLIGGRRTRCAGSLGRVICVLQELGDLSMTLTVRLDPEIERRLEAVCKRRRTTKSAVVSSLVREFVAREPQASSYEVAEKLGLIGSVASGPPDISANAKRYVQRAIRAKHRR